MQKTLLWLLASALLAAGPARIASASEHGSIGVDIYRAMYEPQGNSDALPKLLVYSPQGRCVGVTTGENTPVADLAEFVSQSLAADKQACGVVWSEKFGVTAVGGESGTGVPTVQLISLAQAFCSACTSYRNAIAELPTNIVTIVTTVDLSLAANPDAKPIKPNDCIACEQE